MRKNNVAAASVMLLLLLTAGIQYVSAQAPGADGYLTQPAETEEEEKTEEDLPEGAYEIEPGYEENTDSGVLRWYGGKQAEEGVLVTAAEGFKVCAALPEAVRAVALTLVFSPTVTLTAVRFSFTLAGSPLTISRGPKVMASRMPLLWASFADILLMIITLS